MKARENGCRCVSPFADNNVLADMRHEQIQEETLKGVIAMMQRMTDNMLTLGDILRDDGQTVPGITDWLPGYSEYLVQCKGRTHRLFTQGRICMFYAD